MIDGKPSPSAAEEVVSAKKINDYTIDLIFRSRGRVFTTTRFITSLDGKTRTVTITRTDPQGKPYTNTIVYEKQ